MLYDSRGWVHITFSILPVIGCYCYVCPCRQWIKTGIRVEFPEFSVWKSHAANIRRVVVKSHYLSVSMNGRSLVCVVSVALNIFLYSVALNCSVGESQVCLLETSNGQVWAGSHDTVVYVIDNRDVITCTKTLLVHSDMVVAMTTIARNRYLTWFGDH